MADPFGLRAPLLYWHWIGHGHAASVRAGSEGAARRAILEQFPHARGQRLTLQSFRLN